MLNIPLGACYEGKVREGSKKRGCKIEGRILTLKKAAQVHAYSVGGTSRNIYRERIQRTERGP